MLYMAKSQLKKERQDYGSLRSVAQEMGVDYSYLSQVESNRRWIRRSSAMKICRYFGYDLYHLFYDDSEFKKGGNDGAAVKTRGGRA